MKVLLLMEVLQPHASLHSPSGITGSGDAAIKTAWHKFHTLYVYIVSNNLPLLIMFTEMEPVELCKDPPNMPVVGEVIFACTLNISSSSSTLSSIILMVIDWTSPFLEPTGKTTLLCSGASKSTPASAIYAWRKMNSAVKMDIYFSAAHVQSVQNNFHAYSYSYGG